MLTIKYNPATERYDCYADEEYITTLTCGTKFNLYCEDEDLIVTGRIEYHNTNGYYFIWEDGYIHYLYDGMKGVLG